MKFLGRARITLSGSLVLKCVLLTMMLHCELISTLPYRQPGTILLFGFGLVLLSSKESKENNKNTFL